MCIKSIYVKNPVIKGLNIIIKHLIVNDDILLLILLYIYNIKPINDFNL